MKIKHVILSLGCLLRVCAVQSAELPKVPPLNLGGLSAGSSSSTSSTEPLNCLLTEDRRHSTEQMLVAHFKKFADFYSLASVRSYVQQLSTDAHENSIQSVLFRGTNSDAGKLNEFMSIFPAISAMTRTQTPEWVELHSRMSGLLEIWGTMNNPGKIFIPKGIKLGAGKIQEAEKTNDDSLYLGAKNCLNGTILQIETVLNFLIKYGNFIENLMISQKEFMFIAIRGESEIQSQNKEFTEKLAQTDFLVENLVKTLRQQLTQVNQLLGLIPSVQSEAREALLRLVTPETEGDVTTPRKRGLSKLFKSGSFRNLNPDRDAIERAPSADSLTATSLSPATPRRNSTKKEKKP